MNWISDVSGGAHKTPSWLPRCIVQTTHQVFAAACATCSSQSRGLALNSIVGGVRPCRHNGVLNCGHAAVRRLVVDSLRHWASDYRLDGFCFLNADALTHGALESFRTHIEMLSSLTVQLACFRFRFSTGFRNSSLSHSLCEDCCCCGGLPSITCRGRWAMSTCCTGSTCAISCRSGGHFAGCAAHTAQEGGAMDNRYPVRTTKLCFRVQTGMGRCLMRRLWLTRLRRTLFWRTTASWCAVYAIRQ